MRLNQKKQLLVPKVMICLQQRKRYYFQCVPSITIELKIKIPHGYFENIYPRSSPLKKYLVNCDAGVTDFDFRGTVLILITNNSKDPILIKPGQIIAQIVFHKKEVNVFKKVDCFSSTEGGVGGFGLTGL